MKESPYHVNVASYFNNLIKQLKDPQISQAKGKQLTIQVSKKLEQKIIKSEVILPQQLGTETLTIPKIIVQQSQQSQQQLLRKVQQEKMTLLQKMKDLTKQQQELKVKLRANFLKQKSYFKSNMTQQDKAKLKQLVKQSRMFEKSLERKNKQLTELYRERSLDEMKRHQQMNQNKKQKKRIQILENLKSIQLRSAQRKQAHQFFKKQLKQLKEQKYLYQKNMQKDEQIKLQQQQQLSRKLIDIRNSFKLDIQEIRQHQRRYEEHLQQVQQRMEQKSLQLSKNRRSKSFADNYFSIMMKAKIQQQKAQQYERVHHGFAVHKRISQFQKKISEEFKPKISNASKFTPAKQHVNSTKSLSKIEQRQKGIQYLQISKKLKDLQKQKQRRMTLASPKTKNQYKDYTKQLKYKGYETAQTKFNSLVKYKSSLSNYQSASQALELATQIEAKSKMLTDKKLLNSVRNKIQLLNALE